MSEWDRSMLAMSGAEYEVEEALQSMLRLLDTRGAVRPTTRVVLEGAIMALQNEIDFKGESALPKDGH